MRTSTILVLSLVLPAAAGAQTLTGTSTNTLPGEQFTVHTGSGAAPGAGGNNAFWNYATLTGPGSYTEFYSVPSSSPYASLFPTATVRSDGNDFFRLTALAFEYLGYGSQSNGLIYDDPFKVLVYPCSYSTTWTDAFHGVFDDAGTETGQVTGTADGQGTLVLPAGSFPNVLRVRLDFQVEEVHDTVHISVGFTEYMFYKPGIRHWLMLASEDGLDLAWLDQNSVGVEELQAQAIGVDVFPNPASDAADVVYSADGKRLELDLIDATGAIVQHMELANSAGIQKQRLELADLAKGLYTVRITDAAGGQGVRRLVVQ